MVRCLRTRSTRGTTPFNGVLTEADCDVKGHMHDRREDKDTLATEHLCPSISRASQSSGADSSPVPTRTGRPDKRPKNEADQKQTQINA